MLVTSKSLVALTRHEDEYEPIASANAGHIEAALLSLVKLF